MAVTCQVGHLDIVQLLSAYGASRTFPFGGECGVAERLANDMGHSDVADWLASTHLLSVTIRLFDFPTGERALALLRADADTHARAAELMLIGELLSREERFAGEEAAVIEAWMVVVAHAVADGVAGTGFLGPGSGWPKPNGPRKNTHKRFED